MTDWSHKERKTYQNICHLSERGVLLYMNDILTARYGKDNVIATPGYVIGLGNIPVGLVAHADTVFKTPPIIDHFFYDSERHVSWNPDGAGADDRAGVYAISYIIRTTHLRPHVIITTGEELGCTGAFKLTQNIHSFPSELKFLIQLDRRNQEDSVYYDCTNDAFEKFINGYGFKSAWGTFSDISVLAPSWGVSAVNLSIGYEDEHFNIERLHVDWMYATIEKVIHILSDVQKKGTDIPLFKYESCFPSIWTKPAWYNYDENYTLPEGHSHCFICNSVEKNEDMLPIWYMHSSEPHSICLDCYSDLVSQIVWCKQCGRGLMLSKEEAATIPDLNNWICEDCKNGHKADSAAI